MTKDKEKEGILLAFRQLSSSEKIDLFSDLINELKQQDGNIKSKKDFEIPVGAFSNDFLSSLEVVVKYLKENLQIEFNESAKLLKRSNKTIWATYRNSRKKMPENFGDLNQEIIVPVSVFADRSLSTLECLVEFLKNKNCKNHEIGKLLHLNDRTIWSVYDKVKKKRGKK